MSKMNEDLVVRAGQGINSEIEALFSRIKYLGEVVEHSKRVVRRWEAGTHCKDIVFNDEIRMLKDALECLC